MRRPKYFKKAGIAGLVFLFAFCINGFAETGDGAEEIVLHGGKLGEIPFPHRRHQVADPPNCQTCHTLFPQVKESIAASKEEGTLTSKQVMTGLCIKCHKETAEAGKPSGPQACTVCHVKNSG